jgi:hypothetical protein
MGKLTCTRNTGIGLCTGCRVLVLADVKALRRLDTLQRKGTHGLIIIETARAEPQPVALLEPHLAPLHRPLVGP